MVAATVIKEGFDLPECKAVVPFNLPSTLAQHTQPRGRARKQGSQTSTVLKVLKLYSLWLYGAAKRLKIRHGSKLLAREIRPWKGKAAFSRHNIYDEESRIEWNTGSNERQSQKI
eukprot:Gregarina_sp_Poly_1__7371@NODE_4078_length_744_cov_6_384047_g2665_i0_p1_GENE_NODE_4078_length_744_cov_6_384047_g2665_i0NODE_4078_length_744_cov_6_384047_g2665_i0_p1_ORF_typecomplete_len115_score9_59Helicase_C/PF00271_31/2_6e05_NODE_4078_length_744_cov_6_384047_g2665_i079423